MHENQSKYSSEYKSNKSFLISIKQFNYIYIFQ